MKNLPLYIMLVSGIFCLSCVSSEILTDDAGASVPILFRPDAAGVPEGKSLVSSSEGLNQDGNRLKVYDRHTVGQSSAMYIDGLEYTYGPDGWTSDPIKYWTKDGVHDFTVHNSFLADPSLQGGGMESPQFSYDPASGNLTLSDWTLGKDNQFDFLYAHATRDLSQPNPFAPVNLQMKHLLCAVQFNIVDLIPKTNGEHSTTVKFVNLEIKGFRNSAASVLIPFSGEPEIKLGSSSSFTPIPDTDATNVILEFNKPHNIYKGQTYGPDGSILFFPHSAEVFKDIVYANLKYDKIVWKQYFWGSWYSTEEKHSSTIYLLQKGTATNWRPGHKYVYNIYIQDNNISFDVEVIPWVVDDVIIDE